MKVDRQTKVLVNFNKYERGTLAEISNFIKDIAIRAEVEDNDVVHFLGGEFEEVCVMEGEEFNKVVWNFLDLVDNYMI